VVGTLAEDGCEVLTSTREAAFDPFVADGRYEVPGVALTAVAR
jgi:hypothetical protein